MTDAPSAPPACKLPRNPWRDADVEKHWDAVAAIYVRENARVAEAHDQRFLVATPYLSLVPGARVLNVSSRDAGAEEYLRQACGEIELVHAEISQGLIDVARGLHPHARQVKLNTFSKLPFADGEFDRVLSLETLEHAAEPAAFLAELYRVARPGATLVLSCPPATAEVPYVIYTALFGGHGEGPHRFLPTREVLALLAAAGWRVTTHWGTLLLPVGPRWLRRRVEKWIERHPRGWLGELGIRQFYVAQRA